MLHVAGHNVHDAQSPGGARIAFRDGDLTPTSLNQAQATRSLASARPLVFLNACRTSGSTVTATGLTSWATRFADAGAGAIVGSSWAVRDTSARTFVEAFYDAARSGMGLGATAEQARAAIRAPGDPTWLAYTVFGDPLADLHLRP